MHRYMFSLRQKVFLALSLILLPVVIASVYGYYRNRELLKKHILNDLNFIAESYEKQVFLFIEMSRRSTNDFASDGVIINALTSRKSFVEARLSWLKRYIASKKLFLDTRIETISVISTDGVVVSSTDDAFVGLDLSSQKFFIEGMRGPSTIEARDHSGKPQLVLSSPITGPNGRAIGVLANHIQLSRLSHILNENFNKRNGAISWKKGHPDTMEIYIVNRDGKIIAGSMSTDKTHPDIRLQTEPVAACARQEKEISGFY